MSGETGPRPAEVPFQAHVELLQLFLANRDEIVERLQGVLNAQRKPIEYLRDGPLLSRQIEDCFFAGARVTQSQSRLRGQLEDAHWASGFRPRVLPGLHNGLVDPAEMMIRAFHLWQQTRWPGRSGRIHYAHTLFNVYVIRCLKLLSMRLWDAGSGGAGDRLSLVQDVLDQLWAIKTADQPVLVRDARWLIQMAQSPATDELGVYFDVAKTIAETLSEEDRIEIHKVGVRMAAGHLRSQIRYYCIKKGVSLEDPSVILSTRNTNALDFALLIQELVPLLEAYEHAWHSGDARKRLDLADAICQGVSPDPELFLNRVDLLGAYSMIEHLFIATNRPAAPEPLAAAGAHAAYTPMGQRHVQLLREYEARIGRVSEPLSNDCLHFRPVAGAYSPYGALYGFSTDLVEHMALKTLQPDAVKHFSLEDVFVGEDGKTGKLAWVSGWRQLPHLTPDVQKLFDYPQQFAEDVFDRITHALRTRVSDDANAVVPTGRLFILPGDDLQDDSKASPIPDLPVRYIGSSDAQIVAAQKADWYDETQLSSDRREGRCLLSFKSSGGWVAITKAILTEVLGAGHDAKLVGLPPAAVEVLKLMCPNLVMEKIEA